MKMREQKEKCLAMCWMCLARDHNVQITKRGGVLSINDLVRECLGDALTPDVQTSIETHSRRAAT